jgi:pilus assembly protein FimV
MSKGLPATTWPSIGVIPGLFRELEINNMSRRLSRISLALLILLSGRVWALGLGDIRLDSALNEPLRAEIELLAAAPEELNNLKIGLASADTFERYGLDRPFYLQEIEFTIVRSGSAEGNVIRVRSRTPMSEPFLTFLVEATWSRGRLLREYTVLLDPPTFAPPSMQAAPAVQAPSRAEPADSGQIRRPSGSEPQAEPAPAPTRQAAPMQPRPEAVTDTTPYDREAGGDYLVHRSETLWGIASRVRPDERLTMNQTMLAIFQANPEAFGGNINILRAGASLRIPSADDIFQINRSEALAEAQRQHAAWRGGTVPAPDTGTRPSLTLVPPDEEYEPGIEEIEPGIAEQPQSREDEIEQRIAELEAADVPQQQSLIEIRDNELAALRQELARIRGETYEPPVEETVPEEIEEVMGDEEPLPAEGEIFADEEQAEVAPEETAAEETPPTDIIRTPTRRAGPSLVDRIMGILTEWWMIIVGVLVIVGAALFWFMRRGGGEDDDVDSWQPLDADDMGEDLSGTESLRAPMHDDESIVVVEQESTGRHPQIEKTVVSPPPKFDRQEEQKEPTGSFDSLEDTFSSETAINLDQSDPIAEADFHMAYGLYDQAADLINGALEVEPRRHDLLTKLCEIYFVWGNRDAFIDAAGRLKKAVGGGDSADWDKIVIMGQQIAADDALFAGASAKGATRAVDLSLEGDLHDTGALDMELISEVAEGSEVIDLSADDGGDDIDFFVDDDSEGDADSDDRTSYTGITREMPSAEESTAEMPSMESTLETPTIEQQFDSLAGTAELPSLEDELEDAIESSGQASEETAEINLDDLGLDVDGLAETELASLDDLDATGEIPTLSDTTGINEQLQDVSEVTGKNLEIDDLDSTGMRETVSADDTGINEALDDTSFNRQVDESLLDATGMTQVLSSDLAVDTTTDAAANLSDEDATMLAGLGDDDDDDALGDDQETLLASLDDGDDFDFAKTEALPKDVFTGNMDLDETGELPAVASTDVDLDLDDLTAALEVSEAIGDTVEQQRDDATVEQPRPRSVMDDDDDGATLSLGPDDMSDDLHDARTMTEVGTKLDLARAYVDMGDPGGARSILEEVLDEGDDAQRQQAQQLLDSLPG